MLDLGVSSMQLDQAERGFSFMRDGPLDMRMGATGTSAEDVVNEADPALLVSILSVYGEERRARAIVRALVARREAARITRTGELAEVVCSVLGQPRGKGAHPATQTFQALRIYLNDELGELLRGLHAAERLLRPGGRLVVVTFHSLEDRMVKKFLANRSGRAGRPSRHLPEQAGPASSFEELPKRTQKAGADELARNSRARSARLRGAVRTGAPAFPEDESLLPAGAPQREHAIAVGGRP
jgi:16S rRNA (cytosine1402-N4)-methyltransferase